MPEKISILKESGETLSSNVVSVFMIPDTEKRYIITTENAVDPHGLTVLHASEIVDGTLQKVATDEEWSSIKTVMRAIISGNIGSYQYLPAIENINASGQYSRDISVSASATKQMIDNYAAGEKSAVSASTAPVQPSGNEALGAEASQPQVPQASTIFPTGGVSLSNDDELIPGISEIASAPTVQPVPVAVSAEAVMQPNLGAQTVVDPILQQPVVQTVPPVQPTAPVADPMASMTGANMTQVEPLASPVQPVPTASPVDAQLMNNEVQVPNIPVAPVPSVPMPPVDVVSATPVPMANPEPMNFGVSVANPDPVNLGVQVAGPTQVVPTAQIVQGSQTSAETEIKFDLNAAPSFDPNATLDEVVAGAQAMFMEGVKNLVQTIQEKVYRDLYNKEIELKNREAALEERERLLNSQTPLSTVSPQTVAPVAPQVNPTPVPQVQPVAPVQPVQGVVSPVVNGPTIVSAANDVI